MRAPSPLEDRATLDGFRRGDRATLTAVYRAHAPEVAKLAAHGFSFRSADEVHRFFGYREPHEQQDAVQEVFIRAFSERGRQGFDGLRHYGAYLRGILKNLVIDELRKRKSAVTAFGVRAESSEAVDEAEAPVDSPEVQVHRGVIIDAVRGFVDTLSAHEKRFVALRYTEGLAQQDVATRLRVGRSTVRTLEDRVRGKLHARLRSRGLLEERAPPSFLSRAWRRLVPALTIAAFVVVAGGSHG